MGCVASIDNVAKGLLGGDQVIPVIVDTTLEMSRRGQAQHSVQLLGDLEATGSRKPQILQIGIHPIDHAEHA